jgi:hypothetical protein
MDQCRRFYGVMFLGYQSGVLLGGSCTAGPLRSFPLARGGWSRARSSSCVLTSLPVPESSGCPGVPVLWVGWSFGAPLQPVEPFSWFWAGAKEIVAISISAAKAYVASACIIISRRMYNGKRCKARKFHASVLYRHCQRRRDRSHTSGTRRQTAKSPGALVDTAMV